MLSKMVKVTKVSSVIAAEMRNVVAVLLFKTIVTLGYLPQVKQQITDIAVNGSGIRDTARVLKISPTTVIEE